MAGESVFVVRRQDFFAGEWPQGFRSAAESDLTDPLAQFAAAGFFADRATAEQNPEWKQLIPYCVIRCGGSVFCVQRRPAQTETRLHHLLSIGIGGHCNPEAQISPAAGAAFFGASLRRELREEMTGLTEDQPQPVFQGLLNDDSNEVGRVHAGLVYTLDWPAAGPGAPVPRIREASKMLGGFRSLAELAPLWQDPGRFESWSRLLFKAGVAGARSVSRAGRMWPGPDSAQRNSHG